MNIQIHIRYFLLLFIIISLICFKFKNEIKNEYFTRKFNNEGFVKISNIISDEDIEFFNDFILNFKVTFPECISNKGNNMMINNIDRYSIKLTPGLPKYYHNNRLPNVAIGKIRDFKNYEKKYGNDFNQGTFTKNNYKNLYLKDTDTYKKNFFSYICSPYYIKLLHYTSDLLNKLKIKYPNIFKLNYEIYHIIAFFVLPGSTEQEIHKDDFYFDFNNPNFNKDKNHLYFSNHKDNFYLDGIQLFIPLHDTPTECGPTIIYKKNKIDYEHIKNKNYDSRIGYFNSTEEGHSIENDNELKQIFTNARTITPLKKGDVIFMDNNVFHSGGKNNSNITREFILIQILNIPDYTNHKKYPQLVLENNLFNQNNGENHNEGY